MIRIENLISKLKFDKKKVIFISEKKIWQNCQEFFEKGCLNQFSEVFFLTNPRADLTNVKKIAKKAKNFDLIFALGSGTINDLCKLAAFEAKIPYTIFASAASMNGYLSKNASIEVNGHKKTLPAAVPIMVYCDLKVLKASPIKLTKAGIGDAMCFYSCWFDWYLSHLILGTEFNKEPFELLEEKMRFFVENYKDFAIKDEKFLGILMEILILSGQGMTIAGGSYPASQSEHLIAHTISMKHDLSDILHGQQIAVTTITSAKIQKDILDSDAIKISKQSFPKENLEKFFDKKIAKECEKEFAQKTFDEEKINKQIADNLENYKAKLKKLHLNEVKLKEIFKHFKIKHSAESLGISSEEYKDCVDNAKYIRNRFTCLDLQSAPFGD